MNTPVNVQMRTHRMFKQANHIDMTETCFAGKTKMTMAQLRKRNQSKEDMVNIGGDRYDKINYASEK